LEVRKLANIKSAKKRAITAAKRTERNKMVKSSLRTAVRKFNEATGTESATVNLNAAFKALDMAATKGVIHKNTAARKKARLAKKLSVSAAKA
jgi:small subunit ribosomal protein S20